MGFSPVGSIFGPNVPGAALAAMGVGTKPLFFPKVAGVIAAIANAIHDATGKRIRNLPITLDKLL